MEYVGVIGVEVADMLVSVNQKVWALEPQVPAQHTFGGNGLQDFIHDYQDHLEHLKGQVQDLTMMMEHVVGRLSVANEAQRQLINKLLVWVMVLEGSQDSLEPIPIPAPGGNLLMEIVDGTDDVAAQANMED